MCPEVWESSQPTDILPIHFNRHSDHSDPIHTVYVTDQRQPSVVSLVAKSRFRDLVLFRSSFFFSLWQRDRFPFATILKLLMFCLFTYFKTFNFLFFGKRHIYIRIALFLLFAIWICKIAAKQGYEQDKVAELLIFSLQMGFDRLFCSSYENLADLFVTQNEALVIRRFHCILIRNQNYTYISDIVMLNAFLLILVQPQFPHSQWYCSYFLV